MDEWLVRTAQNVISGPFTKAQIRQLIHEGQIGPQDEVCSANHFWFFLYEHNEVVRQLDIELPKSHSVHNEVVGREEITETETDPLVRRPGNRGGEGTSDQALAVHGQVEYARGPIEGPTFWRAIAWFLLLAACFLVFFVLKVLREPA